MDGTRHQGTVPTFGVVWEEGEGVIIFRRKTLRACGSYITLHTQGTQGPGTQPGLVTAGQTDGQEGTDDEG